MAEEKVNLYEGLFLLGQQAGSDLGGCVDHVKELFKRAEAEVLALRKWDERRLAYRIKGQKRGTYLLAYFRANSQKMIQLERDCNLSEMVTRHMCIKADHLGETELELAVKEGDLELELKLRDEGAPPPTPVVPGEGADQGSAESEENKPATADV